MHVDIPDANVSWSGNSVEDISGIDISGPDHSDLPLELNIPWFDESAASDSDLSTHLDFQVTSGDNRPPSELRDVVTTIELLQLQIAQQYIDLLCCAFLESSGMQAEDILDLHNLGQEYTHEDLSPLLCYIQHFINNSTAS